MASAIVESYQYLVNLFSGFLQNIVIALITLLAGFIIARILGRLVTKVLNSIHLDKNLAKAANIKTSFEQLIGIAITYIVYFITVVIALNQLNATNLILNIVSIAIILLLLIAVILGIKDIMPNLIAGLFLHQRGFLKNGDRIKVKNIEGKIIHVNLFETRIEAKNKDTISIPNIMLMKNEVVKYKKAS